jgi:aldose sugar dehydrogenase
MSEKLAVPDTEENAERCRCPECPVYNDCLDKNNERLFCSKGNTECSIEKKGCLCLHCPNEIEYRLNSFFYCEKGFATEKNVATKNLNSYK